MSEDLRFNRLSTAVKLLLILTIALLPMGLALSWLSYDALRAANQTNRDSARDQAEISAQAIQGLIARNVLSLRIAANGAMVTGKNGVCQRTEASLAIAPALARNFEIEDVDGKPICSVGEQSAMNGLPIVAPGDFAMRVDPGSGVLAVRAGIVGGMATDLIPLEELKAAARDAGTDIRSLVLRDERGALAVIGGTAHDPRLSYNEIPIVRDELVIEIGSYVGPLTPSDRLILFLPVVMWLGAALIGFFVVTRILIRPLKKLERAIGAFQPGETELDLPSQLGPSQEIQQLRNAFGRAITRIDESERDMANALDGQRRLVREVHHRVKNNLQVVASLLSIHGRSAEGPEAKAAYASIGRRVGALSVVHRNHFAEMEESRGISLRPLIAELAAELRASAPADARQLSIELAIDAVFTTQDVAVAIAFLITEIVEFSMIRCPSEPIEIELRRSSELTARLAVTGKVLDPEDKEDVEKVQFERIVSGLSRQLRSQLERKLGRYSVELPVFPHA